MMFSFMTTTHKMHPASLLIAQWTIAHGFSCTRVRLADSLPCHLFIHLSHAVIMIITIMPTRYAVPHGQERDGERSARLELVRRGMRH